jgi:MFS family permease
MVKFFPADFQKNVRLQMTYTLLDTSFRGIWSDNILSLYTYLIANNSNFLVGMLTGIVGATQVVFTLLTALAADNYSRVFLLRVGGFLSFIGIITTSLAVLMGHYLFLLLSMIVWGLSGAFTSPASDAILADSIDAGNRSRVYSWSYTMNCFGRTVGPLVSVIMFATLGDDWKINECKAVMLFGLVLLLFPTALLFLFEETPLATKGQQATTSDEEEGCGESQHGMLLDSSTHEEMGDLSSTLSSSSDEEISVIYLNETPTLDQPSTTTTSTTTTSGDSKSVTRQFLCFPDIPFVPAMIALADVISGLASGMTIKFFPIFFVDSLKMSPVQMNLLYAVSAFPSEQ